MASVIQLWKTLHSGAAFERCVRAHIPRLYRLAWRLTGSEVEADDLLQETLLRVYPKRDEVLQLDAPGPWLARVMHNAWVDRWRRRGIQQYTDSLDDPESDTTPAFVSDEPLLVAVEVALLNRALQQLPEHHRVVIVMHDAEGYTLQEVSEIIDVPLGTLKSRLHRAREGLRELVRNKQSDGTLSAQTAS